jgi:hypothetical protein
MEAFKIRSGRFARPKLRRIFRLCNKILHFVQDKLTNRDSTRSSRSYSLLKEKGYKIVVVTNQSAVARGRLTEEQLKQIDEEVRDAAR